MMADPEQDAWRVLAKAHAVLDPLAFRPAHREAVRKLVTSFLELCKAKGLTVAKNVEGNGTVGFGGLGHIVLLEGGDSVIYLRYIDPYKAGTAVAAALEFDPVTSELVGTVVDDDIAPTPGERLPRVHPLVILARLAAHLFEAAQR